MQSLPLLLVPKSVIPSTSEGVFERWLLLPYPAAAMTWGFQADGGTRGS